MLLTFAKPLGNYARNLLCNNVTAVKCEGVISLCQAPSKVVWPLAYGDLRQADFSQCSRAAV